MAASLPQCFLLDLVEVSEIEVYQNLPRSIIATALRTFITSTLAKYSVLENESLTSRTLILTTMTVSRGNGSLSGR